jgi:hypothetical protein
VAVALTRGNSRLDDFCARMVYWESESRHEQLDVPVSVLFFFLRLSPYYREVGNERESTRGV